MKNNVKKIERKVYAIDAAGKTAGRLATEIARILQGKHKVDFLPNMDTGDFVEVSNVKEMYFSGTKLQDKAYRHHTGYAGGLKVIPVKKVFSEKPEEVLRHAVKLMLPGNRLTNERLKRLKFKL